MSRDEFININSNIQKKVLKKGNFGRRPGLSWLCYIVINEENSDIIQKDPIAITIGNGYTIKDRLIEQCVETMNLEEESEFIINIKNKQLKVNIVLISFQEKPYIFQWADGEKIEAANLHKVRGTELFRENKIEEAFYKFSLALKIILTMDAVLEEDFQEENIRNLLIALYNNLAGCQLHFQNFLKVIKLCNNSINIIPTSKALYRRSVAFIELKEYEKAENDLINLLKLEPKNKAGLEKYKLVRELDRINRENYQSIVKRMFS